MRRPARVFLVSVAHVGDDGAKEQADGVDGDEKLPQHGRVSLFSAQPDQHPPKKIKRNEDQGVVKLPENASCLGPSRPDLHRENEKEGEDVVARCGGLKRLCNGAGLLDGRDEARGKDEREVSADRPPFSSCATEHHLVKSRRLRAARPPARLCLWWRPARRRGLGKMTRSRPVLAIHVACMLPA